MSQPRRGRAVRAGPGGRGARRQADRGRRRRLPAAVRPAGAAGVGAGRPATARFTCPFAFESAGSQIIFYDPGVDYREAEQARVLRDRRAVPGRVESWRWPAKRVVSLGLELSVPATYSACPGSEATEGRMYERLYRVALPDSPGRGRGRPRLPHRPDQKPGPPVDRPGGGVGRRLRGAAARRRGLRHLPRPRPLPRQGRRPEGDDRRAVRPGRPAARAARAGRCT